MAVVCGHLSPPLRLRRRGEEGRLFMLAQLLCSFVGDCFGARCEGAKVLRCRGLLRRRYSRLLAMTRGHFASFANDG